MIAYILHKKIGTRNIAKFTKMHDCLWKKGSVLKDIGSRLQKVQNAWTTESVVQGRGSHLYNATSSAYKTQRWA